MDSSALVACAISKSKVHVIDATVYLQSHPIVLLSGIVIDPLVHQSFERHPHIHSPYLQGVLTLHSTYRKTVTLGFSPTNIPLSDNFVLVTCLLIHSRDGAITTAAKMHA